MSASASILSRKLPRDSTLPVAEPPKLRALELSVAAAGLSVITLLSIGRWKRLVPEGPELSLWLALVAIVDLLPVRYSRHLMTMSVAVLLAAGMVFGPAEVGLLAFLGSVDVREMRREIGIARALFNRSQIALSAIAAAAVFHAVGASVDVWPAAIFAAILAATADATINMVLVSMGPALVDDRRLPDAFHYLFQEMLFSAPVESALNYLGLALLGLLFAAAYTYVGVWGLVSSLVPVVLVRQSFVHRKRSVVAEAEAAEATRLLGKVDDRVEQERRLERSRIAADLHDEVLPALFKVHLMGQVIKQDVDIGRLLDLDDDLPQLLEATDHAAARMRALISTLRRTSTQPGGVTPTLRLLVDDLRRDSGAKIELAVADVGASPLTQLLLFQIAREAIRNAIRHAEASSIRVGLTRDGLHAVLTVEDDGRGFSLDTVDMTDHFGLGLMRDRARMAGGQLDVRSFEGKGTTIRVRVPLDAPVS